MVRSAIQQEIAATSDYNRRQLAGLEYGVCYAYHFEQLGLAASKVKLPVEFIGTPNSLEEILETIDQVWQSVASIVFVSWGGLFRTAEERIWTITKEKFWRDGLHELEKDLDSKYPYARDDPRSRPYMEARQEILNKIETIYNHFADSDLINQILGHLKQYGRSDVPIIYVGYNIPPKSYTLGNDGNTDVWDMDDIEFLSHDEFCFRFNLLNVGENGIDTNSLRFPKTSELRMRLSIAIQGERFEDAADLKKQIELLEKKTRTIRNLE